MKKSLEIRLQHVEDLLQEQNGLLREFIFVMTGQQPKTQRVKVARPEGFKPKTAADVTVVTREDVFKQQQEEEAKQNAPWREPPAPSAPS